MGLCGNPILLVNKIETLSRVNLKFYQFHETTIGYKKSYTKHSFSFLPGVLFSCANLWGELSVMSSYKSTKNPFHWSSFGSCTRIVGLFFWWFLFSSDGNRARDRKMQMSSEICTCWVSLDSLEDKNLGMRLMLNSYVFIMIVVLVTTNSWFLYGGQFTLSTRLISTQLYSPTDAAPQFL